MVEEQDAAGATVATYVYGWYIDEVLSMERDTDGDGTTEHYFFHADDLYNVTSVTDINGDVVERYEYGDYGLPTILAGPAHPGVVAGTINEGDVVPSSAIGNPYLFNGRRYDPESGFYWYRTRYLDPVHGRFTTRDTIGTWGDPANLGNGYAYVGNNPWTKLDPFGEQWGGISDKGHRYGPKEPPTPPYDGPTWDQRGWELFPPGFHDAFGGGGYITCIDYGTGQRRILKVAAYLEWLSLTGALKKAAFKAPGFLKRIWDGIKGIGSGAGRRKAAGEATGVVDDVAGAATKKPPNTGRGKNNLKPDPEANGAHSSIKRNEKGEITGYETYKPNPQNPKGYDPTKRVDVTGGPHTNKISGKDVPTPHVHGKDVPGGVRPATPTEIPKSAPKP